MTTSAAAKATAANAPSHFTVVKYLVEGNTILTPEELGQILANSPEAYGTNVTFENIRAARWRNLQMAYRDARVRYRIRWAAAAAADQCRRSKSRSLEGRLTDIQVQGNRFFSTPNVLRALPSLHTNIAF